MARKLKSDKLLFTATLLLICTSIVMVYSASAVIAREKWQDPYRFLFKQAAWVLIGLSLVPIVMRIDYRSYRQPIVIWTGLVVAVVALVGVLLFRRGQRREPLAARRTARRPALRTGEARDHPVHGRAARTAHGPHRRRVLRAAADWPRHRHRRRAHPLGAGPRHRGIGAGHRERDDLRGRYQLQVRRGDRARRRAGAVARRDSAALPRPAHHLPSSIPGAIRRGPDTRSSSR